jgi:hypothetical protein
VQGGRERKREKEREGERADIQDTVITIRHYSVEFKPSRRRGQCRRHPRMRSDFVSADRQS